MRFPSLLALLLVVLLIPDLHAQQVGPARGSLVIVGGGMEDPAILERFLDLAGGPQAPIVVIPTAGGGAQYDAFYPGLKAFQRQGATNLTVLHTYDPEEANTDAFVQPRRTPS